MDRGPGACLGGPVTRAVEADYLVVGAGAMGMAFTDALIDHADVRVALVDRRHGVGRPLARRPTRSCACTSHRRFYGVASTVLGGGRIQEHGPEAGLHERADQPTICAYYDDVLADRMLGSGRVEFFAGMRLRRGPHLRLAATRVSGSRCRSAAGSSTRATSPPTSRRRRRRGSVSPTARG